MVDRTETRSLKYFSNSYLNALTASPYAQSQLRLVTWVNPAGPSTAVETRRRRRRMTTNDIASRTANLDQSQRHNQNRPLRNATGRSTNRHNEILGRSYTAQAPGAIRIQIEGTALETLSTVQTNVNRPPRVTSAYKKPPKPDSNHHESDSQGDRVEPLERPNALIEERLGCAITMSYGARPASSIEEKKNRDEIIVMQQYSTGATSLVYRGYLAKGENFSFKSQRRPTSSLSLAFYVHGSIDSVVKECCEFKCAQIELNPNDQKQFHFHNIQKANPCEKCRKEYADKILSSNDKNTLLVQRNKKTTQNPYQSAHIPKLLSSDEHVKEKKASDKDQQVKKSAKAKKSKSTVVPSTHPSELTGTVSSKPSQTAKPTESVTTKPIPFSMETISAIPTTQSEDTKGKSDENPEDSGEVDLENLGLNDSAMGQLLQLFAAFKQGEKFHTQPSSSSKTKRHPNSVENFCYILENTIPISDVDQQVLRGLINLGFTFDSVNSTECAEFLKKIVNERIIFILSKDSMKNLSKSIEDEPQLSAIYVIDSSANGSFDSKFYRGCFPNIVSLCHQLKKDLPLWTYDLTSLCSIDSKNNAMSTLNYLQALKDIVLEKDDKADLKQAMIDFCRREYKDNVIQLEFIDEFEESFQPNEAIRWYLREETFIYKMLTRAWRVFDPDILFQLRYFIQHLHRQCENCTENNPLIVYRTIRIREELLGKIRNYKKGLLSFNEFLFANKNQSTQEPAPTNKELKLVRFQINLGANVPRCEIESNPDEILLNVGTIFRIDDVEEIDEKTFTVQLSTNEDILTAGQIITKDLREAIKAPFPLFRMVRLMKKMDFTDYMEEFCVMLIDDPQVVQSEAENLSLGGMLHSLGTHYYEKKQLDQALSHLRASLRVYRRVLPEDDVRLTPTYNNIGSIHHRKGLNEEALEYHLKAFKIQKESKDPDMDSVAAYAGNIGSVLLKLNRYQEAAHYLALDLQIKQKQHPDQDHPDVAAKYHNLAGVQYRLHQYAEALENYEKCLEIELKCHPSTHPTVSVTYYNMATALEELDRLEDAKVAVQKAIARLLLTKNEDDEEVQMQKKYLQRLEQKMWMKELFSTT